MATAASSGGGPGAGGGGTGGFLFGNIDRRGRLDEEYLSDEAKDNIEHVGTTVTEKNQELAEIQRELPGTRAPGEADASDEEDYDDPNDERVDYSNEREEMDVDAAERARMAKVALAPSKKAGDDDDEDYDDDEDDPSASKPSDGTKAGASTSASGDGPSAAASSKSLRVPTAQDKAASLQKQLLMDARKGNVADKPKHVLIEDREDDPVRFSELFTMPLPKLTDKDFDYSNARVKGFRIENDLPRTDTVTDDYESLLTPATQPEANPDEYFLELDRQRIAAAKAAAEARMGKARKEVKSVPMDLSFDDESDDAQPLDPNAKPLPPIPDSAHDPIVQVPWEEDIIFGDDDSADDMDANANMMLDPNAEAKSTPIISPAKPSLSTLGQGNGKPTPPKAEDEDSDDDMEWEDSIAAPSAPKPPAPAPTPLKAPTPLLSKPIATNPPNPAPTLVSKPAPSHVSPLKPSPITKPSLLSKPMPEVKPPEAPKAGPNSKQVSAAKPPKGAKSAPKGKGKKGANGETGKGRGKGKRNAKAADKKKVTYEEPEAKTEDAPPIPKEPEKMPSEFVQQDLCPNRALADGSWVDDIMWDSGGSDSEAERLREERKRKFSQLILDPNDPNLIFEIPSPKSVKLSSNSNPGNRGLSASRLPLTDPFNISNDYFYSSGTSNNPLKVDRRSLLRGLNNAPPANKCQTTRSCVTDEALSNWHRPKISKEFITENPVELVPFRRRRPKGGTAQIAGQIPKKRGELFCTSKDAYRVALFEYSIEKQPCILPIPGTASRILTYDRQNSAADAAQALKNAAGTPDADTVFMAPEEPPPLHAGDIPANDPPLSTVESHLFAAPCAQVDVPTTDFLVMRRGGKMHVREIDSIVSVGITEPKLEVMAPNTDRFKKYGKERVSLFIIREFMKQQKGKGDSVPRMVVPCIDKDHLFREFLRRRTYPETALVKQLKELARYQNGRYILSAEPAKGFASREAEILRTVNAEETAAFEAMDAGWESLINFGINIFTHPTSQGNLLQAADKTGYKCGPVVGAFVKNQLLQTPWYRSQVVIQAQKAQKKEMVQALTLARIAKDLKEGGSVMESRMLSLSAGDLQRVLINYFRVLARKVPDDLEERRNMVREYAMKKQKNAEALDYPQIIDNIITKHRALGNKTSGPAAQSAAAHSATHVIPLEIQRDALERGIVDKLLTEIDRTHAAEVYANASKPVKDDFGKSTKLNDKKKKAENEAKKPKNSKKRHAPAGDDANAKRPRTSTRDEAEELKQLEKLTKSSAFSGPSKPKAPPKAPKFAGDTSKILKTAPSLNSSKTGPSRSLASEKSGDLQPLGVSSGGPEQKMDKEKLPARIKITKKVLDKDGKKVPQVTYVTDPKEIRKILAEQKEKKSMKLMKSGSGKDGESGAKKDGPGTSAVKIAIKLQDLQAKPSSKKKPSTPVERKKPPGASSKKRPRESDEGGGGPSKNPQRSSGSIGKIKINTKQMKKEREEAAQKRLKAQYGDEDYRARKMAKSSVTSRKKRNGPVQLNGILEQIEKVVRGTEGFISDLGPPMKIERVRPGVKPPPNILPTNLAKPAGINLDFTQPVKGVKNYTSIVKKPMDLGTMRQKCKKTSYKSAKEFLEDIRLIRHNAEKFNTDANDYWVVIHAKLLVEVAEEECQRRSDEIQAAENAIKEAK